MPLYYGTIHCDIFKSEHLTLINIHVLVCYRPPDWSSCVKIEIRHDIDNVIDMMMWSLRKILI